MNGNMFDELRRLATENNELSQDAVNRLILSALAEISQNFSVHVEVENKRSEGVEALKESVEDLSKAVALLSQSVIDLSKQINEVQTDVKSIKENPFVSLGRYIKSKPKQSFLWGIAIFVGFYLLLGFRILSLLVVVVGSVLGIPQESLEWVLNWIGR
jgi:hypothetical protein